MKSKSKKPDRKALRVTELKKRLGEMKMELARFASEVIILNDSKKKLIDENNDISRQNRSLYREHSVAVKKYDDERQELNYRLNSAEQRLQMLRSHIIEYFAAMASEGGVPLPRQVAMQRRLADLSPLGYNPNGCSIAAKTADEEFPPGGIW